MKSNYKSTLNVVLAFLFFLVFNSSNAQKIISGTITSGEGIAIENVVVSISGSLEESVLSDESGYYEFTVPEGGSYTITPCYNAHPLNGVSTFDKVLVANHLSGQSLLISPYQIIAADVDQDDSVGTSDTLILREIITAVIVDFPNEKSWRFIDKDFVFPDLTNPFATVFPEEASVNNLENDTTLSFIGLKIGDVNYSAITFLPTSPDDISNGCASGSTSNNFVNEDQQVEIKAFPNPFEDKFTIDLGKECKQTTIEVYSSSGVRLFSDVYLNTDFIMLDFENGLAGFYFVKVIMADGARWVSVVKG